MTAKEILSILETASKLKTTMRHCYTAPDRTESVADHSWRVALMAMLLREEKAFYGIDMDRVIRMALIHDLGEVFTGDIPTFQKTGSDAAAEDMLYLDWVQKFPEPQRSEWLELLREMLELKSPEAKVYKALDKMEALISHNESDLSTWLPLEYDLQYSYGQKEAECNGMLHEIRSQIDEWTTAKIKEGKRKPD